VNTNVSKVSRRLPIGADVLPGNAGTHFRVWSPKHKGVELVLESPRRRTVSLAAEGDGYHSALVPDAPAGTRYRFRLPGSDTLYPDPASRYQPEGPHGPSEVVDPSAFQWSDVAWRGIPAHGQVLYELHIGTFTKEGTWSAATARLDSLKDLGATCIEVMPVNEFAGRWGWGYDGVDLYAPFHHYGTPDDMRRFVDRAHALGIAVILDLVYNHLGPDGNYLLAYSDDYMSRSHGTDWGDALNFDGDNSAPVREYFLHNSLHWIREYHLDGFRFDATQAIVDNSPEHILSAICRECRSAAGDRSIYIINENEPQNTALVRPRQQGGYGMDALWNDDFHHAAMVALTGRNEAYYTDYLGTAQEFISAAKWGYLYQGQRYKWQKKRRGTPALDLPPTAFVHFLQNHDQVANSGTGLRVCQLSSPGQIKAMTALLLLMPQTPMLFQGQEFASSAPFFYFTDHNPELSKLIRAGRAKEIGQFPSAATPEMQSSLNDPGAETTFTSCKLDHSERERGHHKWFYDLHRDLLRLRREEPVFRRVARRGDIDGAVLGPEAFVLRYFAAPDSPSTASDLLLVVNLGRDIPLDPAPEPLLAAPPGERWQIVLSTEDPKYGGAGTPPPDTEREGWHLHGRCAMVLRPVPVDQAAVDTRFRVEGSAQSARAK
jgi:maltooligosyltrehalose trehalohydrolase